MTRLPKPATGETRAPITQEEAIRRARKVMPAGTRGDDLAPGDVDLAGEERELRARVQPSLLQRIGYLLRQLIKSGTNTRA